MNELDDFSGVAEKMNTCVQIFNKKATKCLRKKSIHIKMIQVVFLGILLLKSELATTVNVLQQIKKVNL